MGVPRPLAHAAILAVVCAAGPATAQQAPMRYDLRQPLCRQLQLGPDLMAALTPPLASSLGLPEPVRPLPRAAGAGGVAPVHLGGPTVPPAAGAAPVQPALPGVAPVQVTMDAAEVFRRIKAGEGSTDIDRNLRLIEPKVLIQAVTDAKAESPVNLSLVYRVAAALVDSGLDLVAPGALPAVARQPVADELMRRRDERCVALCELALSEFGRQNGPVPPLTTLATFYRWTKQYDKAVATWMRGGRYTSNTADWLDYETCAGIDLMRSGDRRRGGALVIDAVNQAVRNRSVLRLAQSVDSAGFQLCNEGIVDTAEGLVAASEGLAQTEAAGLWHLQRCRLLLAQDKLAEAQIAGTAGLDAARAALAAATDGMKSTIRQQVAAAEAVAEWFALRGDKPMVVAAERLQLTIGGPMGLPVRVTTRTRGTLTCTSSAEWLICRVTDAGPRFVMHVPQKLVAYYYNLTAKLGANAPPGGQAKITLRWVDGGQSSEIELPVVVGRPGAN